jgi:hypothetical protein
MQNVKVEEGKEIEFGLPEEAIRVVSKCQNGYLLFKKANM